MSRRNLRSHVQIHRTEYRPFVAMCVNHHLEGSIGIIEPCSIRSGSSHDDEQKGQIKPRWSLARRRWMKMRMINKERRVWRRKQEYRQMQRPMFLAIVNSTRRTYQTFSLSLSVLFSLSVVLRYMSNRHYRTREGFHWSTTICFVLLSRSIHEWNISSSTRKWMNKKEKKNENTVAWLSEWTRIDPNICYWHRIKTKIRAVFTRHSLSTSVDTFQSAHTDIFHIYIIIHAVFRTFTSETTLFNTTWKIEMSVIRCERKPFLTERCFNCRDDSFVHADHAGLKSFSNTPDLRKILAVEIGYREKGERMREIRGKTANLAYPPVQHRLNWQSQRLLLPSWIYRRSLGQCRRTRSLSSLLDDRGDRSEYFFLGDAHR